MQTSPARRRGGPASSCWGSGERERLHGCRELDSGIRGMPVHARRSSCLHSLLSPLPSPSTRRLLLILGGAASLAASVFAIVVRVAAAGAAGGTGLACGHRACRRCPARRPVLQASSAPCPTPAALPTAGGPPAAAQRAALAGRGAGRPLLPAARAAHRARHPRRHCAQLVRHEALQAQQLAQQLASRLAPERRAPHLIAARLPRAAAPTAGSSLPAGPLFEPGRPRRCGVLGTSAAARLFKPPCLPACCPASICGAPAQLQRPLLPLLCRTSLFRPFRHPSSSDGDPQAHQPWRRPLAPCACCITQP